MKQEDPNRAKITRDWAVRFRQSARIMEESFPPCDIDPALWGAMIESHRAMATELDDQANELDKG